MNILAVFAGRRENIEIQRRYLKRALELKLIDEVHYWNYTRNNEDYEYLKNISNLKRVSYNYINLNPQLLGSNSFVLKANTPNSIYIMINSTINKYEIEVDLLNQRIEVLKNSISISKTPIIAKLNINRWHRFRIWALDNSIKINNGKKVYLNINIEETLPLTDIRVKGSKKKPCEILFNPANNNGFHFMDKGNMPHWSEFYVYYSARKFKKATIIKCDDDIVYIDLARLPDFISYVNKSDKTVVFANTINNGVSAYHQQLCGLIPKRIGDFEYPNNGLCGSLWASAEKATALHKFFIRRIKRFIKYKSVKQVVEIKHRFSINFIAIKGENWHLVKTAGGGDDERFIEKNINNKVLYEEFFVSHLSFYKQLELGIDLPYLRSLYMNLANRIGL